MKHLIKVSMVLLAAVSTYFVFDTMRFVVPVWVAVASSISLVSVYVGLAYAEIRPNQRDTAMVIAGSALSIEAGMGIIHTLRVLSPSFFVEMPMWAIILLSVLFGTPFSILLFSVVHFVIHQNGEYDIQDDSLNNDDETTLRSSIRNQTQFFCPICGAGLETRHQFAAAKRYGHCHHCKNRIVD